MNTLFAYITYCICMYSKWLENDSLFQSQILRIRYIIHEFNKMPSMVARAHVYEGILWLDGYERANRRALYHLLYFMPIHIHALFEYNISIYRTSTFVCYYLSFAIRAQFVTNSADLQSLQNRKQPAISKILLSVYMLFTCQSFDCQTKAGIYNTNPMCVTWIIWTGIGVYPIIQYPGVVLTAHPD